eukprot:8621291-Pyramimonas_sp.AAC.1
MASSKWYGISHRSPASCVTHSNTGGFTVGAGECTVKTGGFADRAGGFTVGAGGLTVRAGGLTVREGGFTVEAGGLTVRAGGFTVNCRSDFCPTSAPKVKSRGVLRPSGQLSSDLS